MCQKVCVVVLSIFPSLTMTQQQMQRLVQGGTLKTVDELDAEPFGRACFEACMCKFGVVDGSSHSMIRR